MIINGSLIQGKRRYNIKALSYGEYLQYVEYVKNIKDGFKVLNFLLAKTVFRTVELRIFGKTIWKTKVFDFKIEKEALMDLKRFQNDFFKVIFGEDFLAELKERGEIQADITRK